MALDKSVNMESLKKPKLIPIRLHLLSAEGEYSGGMICYITMQISNRRREENVERQANKEPAVELTKHMCCSCRT